MLSTALQFLHRLALGLV